MNKSLHIRSAFAWRALLSKKRALNCTCTSSFNQQSCRPSFHHVIISSGTSTRPFSAATAAAAASANAAAIVPVEEEKDVIDELQEEEGEKNSKSSSTKGADKTSSIPTTTTLHIVPAASFGKWPMFQILNEEGCVVDGAQDPDLGRDLSRRMYSAMVRLQELDKIFYNAQRQGRMSFYMTSTGEEGLQMATAAALDSSDTIFGQYREPGLLIWRGFTLQDFADQCFSNAADLGKGRQMPVHYGSKALHYHTISSPLATQIPQASGAAYALKLRGEKQVVCCFFGEGAASEGDFHAALNFAATTEAPVIFFCRNNGYAISTPCEDQYRGDGIVSRAPGYGMHGVRVDGNDVLAVYSTVKEARRIALEESRPVLIEAMTYRVGHHSTSDDWSRYRLKSEVQQWESKKHPVARFRKYMEANKWWTEQEEVQLRDEERLAVLQAVEIAERKKKPMLETLFEDVYHDLPPHLKEQQAALLHHIAKYPGKYPHD